MSFNYSPKIITDGLVLCLDAANTKSYSGSGTTWSDLSKSGNDGILTNGPTFNSANGGSIVFDGTNDHVSILNGSFGYSPGTTGGFSLEIWVYPTGPYTSYTNEPPTTNLGGFIGQSYFGNTVGWGIGMFTSGGINYWAFQTRSFGNVVQPPAVAFTNNSWYHVVGSFARNDFSRLYVNGELKSSVTSAGLNGVSITPITINAAIARGGRDTSVFFSGCKIPISKVYNRALSATEVLQNYNATKSRFGL